MKTLILLPQFIDRAGRTVYHIKDHTSGGYSHTPVLGEIRLPENDGSSDAYEAELEWAQEQEDE